MRTIYLNEIWHGDKEVVRGLIVVNKTIIEDLEIMFSEKVQNNIKHLIMTDPTKTDGFHFFTRCCQFVVYFQYNTKKVLIGNTLTQLGISIEVMYFGTSDYVNDVFDYMLKLRNSGWEERSREEIVRIAREIKSDYDKTWFEIAEIEIKDHYQSPSSYT
jgi:hypothetical protein